MLCTSKQWLKVGGTPFPGPYKLLASVPRPHTAVNGTSRLRGAPSAYSRAPNFSEFLGPQSYTLTTASEEQYCKCDNWLNNLRDACYASGI